MTDEPAKPKSFRDPVEPETRAEWLLADCVLSGEIADVSDFEVEAEKEVRAEFLRNLCLNAELKNVDPLGIQLGGARVTGTLNLESAVLDRSLWFFDCTFTDQPDFADANGKSLGFIDCTLPGILADRFFLKGNLSLNGATVTGEVRLLGANVDGQVDCVNASFSDEGRNTFTADGLKVGGGLFFRDATLTGITRLLCAKVDRQVECVGAVFTNQGGDAFCADGLEVEGDISFQGAKMVGETRLLGAKVGGQVNCSGATFTNEGSMAFAADGLKVGGDISFQGATMTGETCLSGVRVGGQVNCSEAAFMNEGDAAFIAGDIDVGGPLFFTDLKTPVVGGMSLNHASVDSLIADGSGWPDAGLLDLDGFRYRTLGGYEPWKVLLGWIELQPLGQFTPQPYEQAMKVYREAGHIADAREMGIAKMEAYRKYGDLSPAERVWLWIAGPLIKYGYKPWRALYYALGVFALSVFVFAYAFDAGHMEPSKERVYLHECYQLEKPTQPCAGWVRPARWWVLASPYRLPVDYPTFNPITYSLDTIVPIVDLHQEAYWLPRDTKPWGGFFRAWHWLHIGLGWMLTTLFVTGLTGIVKKD